ncbi:immunity 22 family protein [Corynebacterium freneyi]
MNKDGAVSIWCGDFATEEELLAYVEFAYDNDDDDEPASRFLTDTGLAWFDEDLAEASFDDADDIIERVREHSYGQSFPERLDVEMRRFAHCSSLYLLYDVDASGTRPNSGPLNLVGVYPYDRSVE